MNDKYDYDLAVIGSGPGGYVAAVRAAELGLKTICIDKRELPGGTCLNVGCIPSKSLLHSSEIYSKFLHESAEHGIQFKDLSIDFSTMMKRKQQVVKSLCDGVLGLFKRHNVRFAVGTAQLIDPHRLQISREGKTEDISAAHILLATGSEPIALQQIPFDERQVVSSTGALALPKIPKRMIVIGGGVIGVELASVYNRLGAQVTIIEMLDHICPAMDSTISQWLLKVLKHQGIEFLLSTQMVSAVVQPDEVILTLQQGDKLLNLSGDVVLVSVGRRPYSEGLGLEKVGISLSSKGFVDVDDAYRTIHPHIFAIGDLVEGVMLAHRASEEGVAVVEMIAGRRSSVNTMTIPNVIYTNPEVAAVGLTEKEAKDAGVSVKVGMSSFKGNPRARCSGEMEGIVKVIGDLKTGRLVGMHIIGPHASELISEGMMAMEKKATLRDLAYAPNAHPTLSEAIKEAAIVSLN